MNERSSFSDECRILLVDPHDPFRYSNFIIPNMGLAYLAAMAGDIEGSVMKIGQLAHLINRDYSMEIDSLTDLVNMCLSLIDDLKDMGKEEEAGFLLKISNQLLEYHAIIHKEKDVKNTG